MSLLDSALYKQSICVLLNYFFRDATSRPTEKESQFGIFKWGALTLSSSYGLGGTYLRPGSQLYLFVLGSQTQCLTEVFRFEKFYVVAITANLADAQIQVAILLKLRREAFQNLKMKFLFYLHGECHASWMRSHETREHGLQNWSCRWL